MESRFDFDQNLNWDLSRRLCLPLWLKDISKLKQLVEKIAKAEYR
jgi:RAVE protein 1 C terminal